MVVQGQERGASERSTHTVRATRSLRVAPEAEKAGPDFQSDVTRH